MTDPLLTVAEVAAHLREHRKTVLDRIAAYRAGDPTGLPAINLGSDGRGARWRVRPASAPALAAIQVGGMSFRSPP